MAEKLRTQKNTPRSINAITGVVHPTHPYARIKNTTASNASRLLKLKSRSYIGGDFNFMFFLSGRRVLEVTARGRLLIAELEAVLEAVLEATGLAVEIFETAKISFAEQFRWQDQGMTNE